MRQQSHAFIFCAWCSIAAFEAALEGAGFRVRSRAVWVKNNQGPGDLGTLGPAYELLIHATRGDARLYRRHPNVFTFDKVGIDDHPTEKPRPLCELLIDLATTRGGLVADPFGGVATTAAAAKATGRGYWSCELEEKYWTAGQKRLDGEGG
jgi:DNA modification methylase